jgi:uncharacterized protein YukE
MTIPIERIRELLGSDADGKTDEQIAQLRDSLIGAAERYYEAVQEQWRRDPEAVRWLAYSAQTGEYE